MSLAQQSIDDIVIREIYAFSIRHWTDRDRSQERFEQIDIGGSGLDLRSSRLLSVSHLL